MRTGLTGSALCLCAVTLSAQVRDPNHETTTADVPGLTAHTSACALSTDPGYALTVENPIKTGGGSMYLAARQVRFLSALRGPAGEGVHFKRAGSVRAPDDAIVDKYVLDIKGDRSTTLYIDGYHWSDPVAPTGFLCATPMNLPPPGPDPFETGRQLDAIAVRLGTSEVNPISIDPDGSKTHAVVYDHVRLIALAARAAASAGQPLDPNQLPSPVAAPHLVAVAGPVVCSGETILPLSVTVTDGGGNQPPSTGTARGEQIAQLSPGLAGPADAIAVAYSVPALIAGARVTIHSAKPCEGKQDVVLPAVMTGPRVVSEAPAPPPPGKAVLADGGRS